MSELSKIRDRIDALDEQICALVKERMSLTAQVAESKRECSRAVRDEARERLVLERVSALCGGEYGAEIYRTIMRCSRAQQTEILGADEQIMFDISREIFSTPAYPGDPIASSERVRSFDKGDIYNLTELRMSVHNATHIDAPLHFIDGGDDILSLTPEIMIGRCVVVGFGGEVTAEDIASLPDGTTRLLIRGAHELTPEVAHACVDKGLRVIGVEGNSVGNQQIHLILLENGVIPIEGLDLSAPSDGEYLLFAMPLKLSGCEGSPCRAILIKE